MLRNYSFLVKVDELEKLASITLFDVFAPSSLFTGLLKQVVAMALLPHPLCKLETLPREFSLDGTLTTSIRHSCHKSTHAFGMVE